MPGEQASAHASSQPVFPQVRGGGGGVVFPVCVCVCVCACACVCACVYRQHQQPHLIHTYPSTHNPIPTE